MSDELIKTTGVVALGGSAFLRNVEVATSPDAEVVRVVSRTLVGRVDRTGWGAGPWSGEPDRCEWSVEIDGVRVLCLAERMSIGAWAGHVAVPPQHFWHPSNTRVVKMMDASDSEVYAHGYPVTRLDNVVTTILDEPVGCTVSFDCAHVKDLAPFDAMLAKRARSELGVPSNKTYRTLDYVMSEVELLARKFAEIENATRRMVEAIEGR